jgi:RNA polymerase sigma-70 factor (ECF subfamily)
MISDTQWAIKYMETGHIPGTKWKVARWNREDREILFDPQVLDRCFIIPNAAPEVEEGVRVMLKHLLSCLSAREREAFVLVKGQGFSYQEAAEFIGLSKGNVYTLIKRAEKKFFGYRNFVGRKQAKGEGVF